MQYVKPCVPFVVPSSSTSSSTTPTPASSSSSPQDSVFDESRYTKNPPPEVEVRVRSHGKPAAQKRETKNKMKDTKKYKAICCMTCRTGFRISERIWWIKVVLQSHGETLRQRIETLPVLLMNYQWSREQKWNRVRVSIAEGSNL